MDLRSLECIVSSISLARHSGEMKQNDTGQRMVRQSLSSSGKEFGYIQVVHQLALKTALYLL
jgi:hypothetical protein